MSKVLKRQDLEVGRRTVIQNATLAIRDVYDAIVELVTNVDDRYQVLGTDGRIEIEVEERRGGAPSILRVRDFADGMTSEDMERKLGRMGGRVSGLEQGLAVRGTNSRGAKDVAALGRVTFESIARDGRFHRCRITPSMMFELDESQDVDRAVRRRLGIPERTGTLVTIEVASRHRIPRHETMVEQVASLVRLRDIVRDSGRELIILRKQQGREDRIDCPPIHGTKRVAVRFSVPGYEDTSAKLLIYRASKPFPREKERFRLGGILVKSRHAIHEATLFDPGLESDSCAHWFYGRLTCEAIDDLWNEFDEYYAADVDPDPRNPVPILDPSRRSGLTRDHPFVDALYGEALKRFRPLVEEERKREENERSKIESRRTRSRLDALQDAANDFMRQWSEEEDADTTRGGETKIHGRRFSQHGFIVSPPFTQLVVGHSRNYSLSVLQESFPELEVGSSVQLEALSKDIELSAKFVTLEEHPTKDGVLQASWSVKGLEPTPASGLRARVGPIDGEAAVEVFASEADRYAHVTKLQFSKARYRVRSDKGRKVVKVLTPLSLVDEFGEDLSIQVRGDDYVIAGETRLERREELGVAIAGITVKIAGASPEPTSCTSTVIT